MALWRKVTQNAQDGLWAYVEFSDENKNDIVILGDKEFHTKEEAIGWSEGFNLLSYVWKDPIERKKEQIRSLFKDIIDNKNKLDKLVKYLEDREVSCGDLFVELENLISQN